MADRPIYCDEFIDELKGEQYSSQSDETLSLSENELYNNLKEVLNNIESKNN